MNGRFVAYYRVSTTKQGIHGLGMDAQRESVTNFLNGGQWELIGEFSECESGKRSERPELQKAIELCRKSKATLLIAKLDRLSRNAAFLLNLQESGVKFQAVDLPVDSFVVGIMALVAQKEREMISERTKAGLAAAKRRGIRLGGPNPQEALKLALQAKQERAKAFADSMAPVVKQIQKAGANSLRQIAFSLTARGYRTPNGREFKAQSVADLLRRMSN
jgi:DNA invertase Pin-like site-specific DNA recombinase